MMDGHHIEPREYDVPPTADPVDYVPFIHRLEENIAVLGGRAETAEGRITAARRVTCTGDDWPDKSWPDAERARYLDGWDAAHKAHLRALTEPTPEVSDGEVGT